MKIAVQILAYNVNRYLPSVLENCFPFVDKVYISHSIKPWGYNPESRQSSTNSTTIDFINSAVEQAATATGVRCSVEVVEGDWQLDEDTRNDLLQRARADGFDWMIVQDADEFYTPKGWDAIRSVLRRSSHVDVFVSSWLNFWKSPEYLLLTETGQFKDINACLAIRCASDVSFLRSRTTTASTKVLLDVMCYHYGYVMSDAEMLQKISTWGHAHQIRDRQKWMKLKWKNWSLESRYLHPVVPSFWQKAIRFHLPQPDFAFHFMTFNPLAEEFAAFSPQEALYDACVVFTQQRRRLASALRGGK